MPSILIIITFNGCMWQIKDFLVTSLCCCNSVLLTHLAMRCSFNLEIVTFNLMLKIDNRSISCDIAFVWMSQKLTSEKPTLIQIMDWCHQGVVSLTFCELSKIFSRNLCIAEITLPMRISSWNLVRVPKAMLWAQVQSFSLKFSPYMWLLALYIFARLFWRARKTLVKQPPDTWSRSVDPDLYCR